MTTITVAIFAFLAGVLAAVGLCLFLQAASRTDSTWVRNNSITGEPKPPPTPPIWEGVPEFVLDPTGDWYATDDGTFHLVANSERVRRDPSVLRYRRIG